MSSLYAPLTVDLTDQLPVPGPVHIAGRVFVPPDSQPIRSAVLCLPGGSYTQDYYHLEVPGFSPDAYSGALDLARRGHLIITVDHLGTGQSTRPADGRQLTAEIVSLANALVAAECRSRLSCGELVSGLAPLPDLPLAGVGHSMGAFLLLHQQARFQSFDAIALLGFGMVHPLFPEQDDLEVHTEQKDGYLTISRSFYRTFFFGPDVPEGVMDADDRRATVVPVPLVDLVMHPETLRTDAADVTVPVFLGNGIRADISKHPHGEVSAYTRAHRVILFLLEKSFHCHHVAPTRHQLWVALATFFTACASSQVPKDPSPDVVPAR